MKCYEYIIKGRVQGVGFRYFTYNKALLYGIKGYVKNLTDGSVEVLAIAEDTVISEFIKVLKKGPSLSKVKNIIANEIGNCPHYNDFKIKY